MTPTPDRSLPSTTTAPQDVALSLPLQSWLLGESSDSFAIDTIRKSPILSSEARQAIPALRQAALRPATEDEIKGVIGSRFELFRQPHRTDEQWAMWWAEYIDALAGLTPYAIEAGMAAWVRSPEAEWMVKPGKLRELAQTSSNNNRWAKAAYRAERATREEPQATAPVSIPDDDKPTPEEVKAMMETFNAKMAAKDPFQRIKERRKPTPQAKVDNSGISAEARAMIERQREQA